MSEPSERRNTERRRPSITSDTTADEMLRDLWHWAFGNGRKGMEQRIAHLESLHEQQATKVELRQVDDRVESRLCALEAKIDSLRADAVAYQRVASTADTMKFVITIMTIVLAAVSAAQGWFV